MQVRVLLDEISRRADFVQQAIASTAHFLRLQQQGRRQAGQREDLRGRARGGGGRQPSVGLSDAAPDLTKREHDAVLKFSKGPPTGPTLMCMFFVL
jgi:hypothetical protein